LAIPTSRKTGKLLPEEVQVERDPETGRILRVIRSQDEEPPVYNPLNDPLNEIPIPQASTRQAPPSNVIAQLEVEAAEEEARLVKRRPRQQSQREEEWLANLVQKHGDNLRAMARDRKLNPMQQTEGDLGRRIRKWKSQGRKE
jgi:nucleolar protein 16